MITVIVAPAGGFFHKNRDRISDRSEAAGNDVFFIFREKNDRRNIMSEIKSRTPDLLITEDLEGFEMCTLTDAVSYNLVHCRQMHCIFTPHPENEPYLNKQLSLVMTFVCPDETEKARLLQTYPDIPEIRTVKETDLAGEYFKEYVK